jgi:hypothetical protein
MGNAVNFGVVAGQGLFVLKDVVTVLVRLIKVALPESKCIDLLGEVAAVQQ